MSSMAARPSGQLAASPVVEANDQQRADQGRGRQAES